MNKYFNISNLARQNLYYIVNYSYTFYLHFLKCLYNRTELFVVIETKFKYISLGIIFQMFIVFHCRIKYMYGIMWNLS